MIVCGEKLERGEKKAFSLPIKGGMPLLGMAVCGEKEGKTLLITAGVHGCEYVGIQAMRRLTEQIQPKGLCGQVIILPLVNRSGFLAGAKQLVPEDGKNLNRVFPGKEDGTLSERIAWAIEAQLYPLADFLLDLHGADINEQIVPLAFFPTAAGEEVCSLSRAAASSLSLTMRVCSTSKNGLYSWAAQRGIPGLLVERGGLGRWSEEEVNQCLENVYELMGFLQMLPEQPTKSEQREIVRAVYEQAKADGFWYPAIKEGQIVQKGQLLGRLESVDSDEVWEYRAEFDGVVMYYTLSLGVHREDPLVAYGSERAE